MMTDAEVSEVEEARYAQRKPTQAEAIRFLIKKGLEKVTAESAGPGGRPASITSA